MKRIYFIAEGPHDVEVIGRLLSLRGFRRLRQINELDEYWRPLVPRTFPIDGDLLRRVPVPVYFTSKTTSVAVHSAGGVSRISNVAKASLCALDEPPDALGVLIDADDMDPLKRWEEVAHELPVDDPGSSPGHVGTGVPRSGVFVLPDNATTGTLEDLLLACANVAYPGLLASAKAWIEPLDPSDSATFSCAKERADFAKPSGKSKAIAGSIASILRPGKAVQVSIQDNMWLRHPAALDLPDVKALQNFVDTILG